MAAYGSEGAHWAAQWTTTHERLATRLTDLGYVLFECCNGGIIRHQIRKHCTAENLTAIPQERASHLQGMIVAERRCEQMGTR